MSELIRLQIAISNRKQIPVYFSIAEAINNYGCNKVIAFSFEKMSTKNANNLEDQKCKNFAKMTSLTYQEVEMYTAHIYTESSESTVNIILDSARKTMKRLNLPLEELGNFIFIYETKPLHKSGNAA